MTYPSFSAFEAARVEKEKQREISEALDAAIKASGYAVPVVGTASPAPSYPWLYRQNMVDSKEVTELLDLLDKYEMTIKDAIKLITTVKKENEI